MNAAALENIGGSWWRCTRCEATWREQCSCCEPSHRCPAPRKRKAVKLTAIRTEEDGTVVLVTDAGDVRIRRRTPVYSSASLNGLAAPARQGDHVITVEDLTGSKSPIAF